MSFNKTPQWLFLGCSKSAFEKHDLWIYGFYVHVYTVICNKMCIHIVHLVYHMSHSNQKNPLFPHIFPEFNSLSLKYVFLWICVTLIDHKPSMLINFLLIKSSIHPLRFLCFYTFFALLVFNSFVLRQSWGTCWHPALDLKTHWYALISAYCQCQDVSFKWAWFHFGEDIHPQNFYIYNIHGVVKKKLM